jgi:hypothetical protein
VGKPPEENNTEARRTIRTGSYADSVNYEVKRKLKLKVNIVGCT